MEDNLPATNMPNSIPPVKRTLITFWLFISLIFALFTFIALSVFGPNPPIEISVATTHITAPLAADGLPDYAAVLRADMKKGVTPENNGAILFLQSMWPEYDEDFSVEDAQLHCDELGMEGPSPISNRITKFDTPTNRLGALRVLRKRLPRKESTAKEIIDQELGVTEEVDPETEAFLGKYYDGLQKLPDAIFFEGPEEEAVKDSRIVDLLSNCQHVSRPWTEQELPFLAKWLEENQTGIDRIVDAANAPKWYLPSTGLMSGNRDSFISINLFSMSSLRNSARILCTRSNYHLGMKQYDLAIQDAIAIMRLANHLSHDPFLVDQLVAIAIAGIGIEQINRIASDPNLPSIQARKLLAELKSLPPIGRMIRTMNQGERFYCLNSLLVEEGTTMEGNLFTDHSAVSEYIAQVTSSRTKVDWNIVFRKQNDFFNSIIAAAKLPTWQQQQAGFDQIYSDLSSQYQENNVLWNTTLKLLTPTSRGDYLADHSISTLNSSIVPCFFAERRARNRFTMAKLAVALAIYRAEQGSYPEKLELLVPSIFSTIPLDGYQRMPFVYHLISTNDGNRSYLIHSLGPNGINDGGSCSEENMYNSGPTSFQGQSFDIWTIPTTEEQKLIDKIPENADDPSLRIPLRIEPWPWESIIYEYSDP